MGPVVSVLVPCFNLGEFLPEAVDSVFAQTFQDFEILVVDDGSTDARTLTVLDNFRRPRTTLFRTENRGLPAARNFLLQHARGRYICALDADDRLRPQFLEKTISLLERDPSLTFVSTWLEAFGFETFLWQPDRCDFPRLLAECVVLTASPVRRDALLSAGGWDESFPHAGEEDWDLWITLTEQGHRGTIVPELLFEYRQRPGSMRRECGERHQRMRLINKLMEKHRRSYLSHLQDVLLLKEAECARLLRDNWQLEREIEARR